MKTQMRTKAAFLILLIGLAFSSCKKSESVIIDSHENDSIKNTFDTVGPDMDTINMDTMAVVRLDTTAK